MTNHDDKKLFHVTVNLNSLWKALINDTVTIVLNNPQNRTLSCLDITHAMTDIIHKVYELIAKTLSDPEAISYLCASLIVQHDLDKLTNEDPEEVLQKLNKLHIPTIISKEIH